MSKIYFKKQSLLSIFNFLESSLLLTNITLAARLEHLVLLFVKSSNVLS